MRWHYKTDGCDAQLDKTTVAENMTKRRGDGANLDEGHGALSNVSCWYIWKNILS